MNRITHVDAQTAPTKEADSANAAVLYIAFELAEQKWKLALSDGGPRPRIVTITARDFDELEEAKEAARERFGLPANCEVVTCYEAGRDGFWLHRKFAAEGIRNFVVDASSIDVNRRKRRAKTDRIDVRKLHSCLLRHCAGEPDVFRAVFVPGVEDEDAREIHRELETLKNEIKQHGNRIQSLLVKSGVRIKLGRHFETALREARLWDGTPLPPHLVARVEREYERMQQARRQKKKIEAEQRAALEDPQTQRLQMVNQLKTLKAIGDVGSWALVMEFFGWRDFKNRKQVGGAAGLDGTPHDTGDSERELGISKAGNRRVRALMIELAWCWLRYQPQSALSRWFHERFGGAKRSKKVGIVALARKLLIALWRFLQVGQVPEGALLKA